MKTKHTFVLLSILCLLLSIRPIKVFGQSESHNFITYDTTVSVVGGMWNLRITRPAHMFTAGHSDTASRPALIFMVGSGEISNPAYIGSYGPHYWLNNGWNGGIQLGNGTHYPIIISVQPYTTGPTSRSTGNLLFHILNTYHIKANGVHLTGLSMGAIRWEMILSAERTAGGEDYMKRITSIAALSGTYDLNGQPDWVRGDLPERDLLISPSWKGAKTWVKKYNGKYLALEGSSDGVQAYLWMGTQPMNDTVPGSAYFSYYPGGHCCWNTMYDPGMTNWNNVGPQALGTFITTGYAPNTKGTYKTGDNIFKWMLKQGDTTLVGSAAVNQPPVASAGSSQIIILPVTVATLSGSGTDPDGTITSYTWTQISGTPAIISSPSSASTIIIGLTAGAKVFRLTVTDNQGATATSDVTITVNAAAVANQSPVSNAGASQTIILPTSSVTLSGSGTDADGTIASYAWTQVSGTAATIGSPSTSSTNITGLSTAGARVFRLTVTDNLGATGSADVTMTVNAGGSGSSIQNETKDFITEDSTVNFPGVGAWNYRISRPRNMFTAGHPDTASRPVIIFMVGVGEACNCPSALGYNGPHAIYNPSGGGWDGGLQLGNGTHYPIYISVQPHAQWPSTKSSRMLVEFLLNKYHIKRNSVHLTGLSMGAMTWTRMINSEVTNGGEESMKLVKSIAALQGQGNAYYAWRRDANGSAPLYQLGGDSVVTPENYTDMYTEPLGSAPNTHSLAWKAYKIWATKYGGRYFSLNGTADYAGVDNWLISEAMNDTLANTGYFAWENIGGGQHCCWNNMYDPNATNWTSVGQLGPGIVANGYTPHANTMGNYHTGDNIFTWMIKQGDTSIVGSAQPPVASPPPISNAGSNQTISLPVTTVTLSGIGSAANGGTILSHTWSKISGGSASITDINNYGTTVSGLSAGVYVFRLSVVQNDNQTATSDVTISVTAASSNVKTIAGKIEAESFDTKSGGMYGVATGDAGGGQHVIGISSGSWMDYNVTVSQPGSYTVNFRVATTQSNTQLQIKSGNTVLATVTIPSTGGWDSWQTVPVSNVSLTAGVQTIRILSVTTATCNFNWMDWVITSASPAPSANAGSAQTLTLPASQVVLSGSGTANNGGTIISHSWSKVSGGSAIITDPSGYGTTVTGLSAGVYVFRLTVTQSDNQTATADITVTVNPAASNGKTIAGKIEAENWDMKSGPQYAVTTTDAGGGQHVIGISNGSWMDYNVTVSQSGLYTVNFRVATTQNTAQFQIKSGNSVLATIAIPGSGSWDNWVTIPVNNVSLTAGVQTIRILSATSGTCNFNWMDWVLTGGSQPPAANGGTAQTITLPVSQVTLSGSGSAANGGTIISHVWSKVSGGSATIADPGNYNSTVSGLSAGVYVFRLTVTQSDNQTATSDVTITVNAAASNGKTIPGKIEAESFDTKSGGMYGVATGDAGGGQHVIGISNGSWMDYNVTVSQPGSYTVNFRVATTQSNTQLQIKSGNTVLGTVTIPSTGGWDSWQTVPVSNVSLSAGVQTIRILSVTTATCNFNWMDWSLSSSPVTSAMSLNMTSNTVLTEKAGVIEARPLTGSGVSIFPNPVTDRFVLQVDNDYAGIMKVQIVDQGGNILKQLEVRKQKGMTRITLSASGMPAGIYLIQVQSGGSSKVVKMVKV